MPRYLEAATSRSCLAESQGHDGIIIDKLWLALELFLFVWLLAHKGADIAGANPTTSAAILAGIGSSRRGDAMHRPE
jgi:hypothetical protein